MVTNVWNQAGSIEYLDRDLSIGERFRLVEIAHETISADIRKWAIDTLERASHRMARFVADPKEER